MIDGTIINKVVVLFFCLLIVRSVQSKTLLFDQCFDQSAQKYGVDTVLLKAIAQQESSFNQYAINARKSDEDVGLMQINSFWFEHLQSIGITRKDLFDPCTSIDVGAWVLAQSIQYFGHNWRAVGAYNAGTSKNKKAEQKREIYAKFVMGHYHRLRDGVQP